MYRSVFLSDVPFNPKTMPNEMKLLLNKHESYEDKYAYTLLSNNTFIMPSNCPQENPELQKHGRAVAIQKPNAKTAKMENGGKRLEDRFRAEVCTPADLDIETPNDFAPLATPGVASSNRVPSREAETETRFIHPVLLSQDTLLSGVQFKTQNDVKLVSKPFELEPTPIMSLFNRQGVDTKTGKIAFSNESAGICISNQTIISINTINGHQRFLIGHNKPVACFTCVPEENLLVSVDSGDSAEVIVWRVVPVRVLCRFTIEMKNVTNIDSCKFSIEDTYSLPLTKAL
jgi:hypothetical protein